MSHPTLDTIADKIARLSPDVAREHLHRILTISTEDAGFAEKLDFNAHLCSRLRELGAGRRIWKDGTV